VTEQEIKQMQSKNTARPLASVNAVSGAGMDKRVEMRKKPWMTWAIWALAAIILVLMLIYWLGSGQGKSLNVEGQRIQISQVASGIFEDFIPVRGRVTPARTLYLDAIEGGRVERILVEDGAQLKAGELIVELSNASMQLNALGNEARVAEQLNNIRTIELNLEQNRLQHKRNLVDIQYQIKMLSRQLDREGVLVKNNSISQSQYDDTADTLAWNKARLALTLESQASDALMQEEQLAFLKETGTRLEHNLLLSRQNLDNMNVKAPVAGTLSGFNIEIGQSIGRGERLGQIDTPNDYKVSALIDEFYLGRIEIGQRAQFDDYELRISKIYPQVQNGQFEVDLSFVDKQPEDIRRGQTLQLKLTLGDATEALLIPNGAFYQDTGGNWLFVLNSDGSEALRRSVRLGRRNNRFFEVIEGLEAGDKVVTSSYSSYQDMQRLNINN
jgi:HlyD family secretion protein